MWQSAQPIAALAKGAPQPSADRDDRAGGRSRQVTWPSRHVGQNFGKAKAGVNPKSKSLQSFDTQFSPPARLRTTLLNLKRDDRTLNIPLYTIPDGLRFADDTYTTS